MKTYNEESIGKFLEVTHTARLTSSEISHLWTTFMHYSTLWCIYEYFISHVDDPDILTFFQEDCINIINTRLNAVSDYLRKNGCPVPIGFSKDDVDTDAPRLFSDIFCLYYTKNMASIGIGLSGQALTSAARPDIREFYTECLVVGARVLNRASDILLSKGLYIRPPYITTIKEQDFVKEQNFLQGFLGKPRPLLAVEIDQLFLSYINNYFGKSLLIGFRQVVKPEKIQSYFCRGIEIAEKHIEIFRSLLEKEAIPVPAFWDAFVTDFTVPPFSDKLMLYHIVELNTIGFRNYATAMSSSLRHDLSAAYARLMAEVANYLEDGCNIMIENGWFEEPPRMIDRQDLVH